MRFSRSPLFLALIRFAYSACPSPDACSSAFNNFDCDTYLPTTVVVYPTQTTTLTVLSSTPTSLSWTVYTNPSWPTLSTTNTTLPPGPTTSTTVTLPLTLPSSLSACDGHSALSSVCACRGITSDVVKTITPFTTVTETQPGIATSTVTASATYAACAAENQYGYKNVGVTWELPKYVPNNLKETVQPNITTASDCCTACFTPNAANGVDNGCLYYHWQNSGTMDDGGNCTLGLFMVNGAGKCLWGDPREGSLDDATRSGVDVDRLWGFGPCVKAASCYTNYYGSKVGTC